MKIDYKIVLKRSLKINKSLKDERDRLLLENQNLHNKNAEIMKKYRKLKLSTQRYH